MLKLHSYKPMKLQYMPLIMPHKYPANLQLVAISISALCSIFCYIFIILFFFVYLQQAFQVIAVKWLTHRLVLCHLVELLVNQR